MAPVLIVNPSSGTDSPTAEELRDAAARPRRRRPISRGGRRSAGARPERGRGRARDGRRRRLARRRRGGRARAGRARSSASRSGRGTTSPATSGLDRDDPIAALAAFDDGAERRIDVARAGDRLFLNNVSLGIYARLVHRREHHRRRRDALARLRALALTVKDRGARSASRSTATTSARGSCSSRTTTTRSTCSRSGSASGSTRASCTSTSRTAFAGSPGTSAPAPSSRSAPPAAAARGDRRRAGRARHAARFRIEPRALRVLVPPRQSDRISTYVSNASSSSAGQLVRLEPAQLDEVVAARSRRRPAARAR